MKKTVTYFYNLDQDKRSDLVLDICCGTRKSPSCVYMWLRGERKPCYLEQKYIQEAIARLYGVEVELDELFGE